MKLHCTSRLHSGRPTTCGRSAELSFRGVDFTKSAKQIRKDFDNVCSAMAAQLAALFSFLEPNRPRWEARNQYCVGTCWLYGLLSFCAKSCEAKKQQKVGGQPILLAKKEKGLHWPCVWSAPIWLKFSVQTHLTGGQEVQGTLSKRRDFLHSV